MFGTRGGGSHSLLIPFAREFDAGIDILPQQSEDLSAKRFGHHLCALLDGPNRIGLLDHQVPALLIMGKSHRKSETEQKTEQYSHAVAGRLNERLALFVHA